MNPCDKTKLFFWAGGEGKLDENSRSGIRDPPPPLRAHEALERGPHLRLVGQVPVALEHERRAAVDRLLVVLDVPDAGGVVLGGAGAGWVRGELPRCAVGAHQGGQLAGVETFGLEECVQGIAG